MNLLFFCVFRVFHNKKKNLGIKLVLLFVFFPKLWLCYLYVYFAYLVMNAWGLDHLRAFQCLIT